MHAAKVSSKISMDPNAHHFARAAAFMEHASTPMFASASQDGVIPRVTHPARMANGERTAVQTAAVRIQRSATPLLERVPACQVGRALNAISPVILEGLVLHVDKFANAKMEEPATLCPGRAPARLVTWVYYAKKFVLREHTATCVRATAPARTVAPVIRPMAPAPVLRDGLDLPVPTLVPSDSTEGIVVSDADAKTGPPVTVRRDSAYAVQAILDSCVKINVPLELTGLTAPRSVNVTTVQAVMPQMESATAFPVLWASDAKKLVRMVNGDRTAVLIVNARIQEGATL